MNDKYYLAKKYRLYTNRKIKCLIDLTDFEVVFTSCIELY